MTIDAIKERDYAVAMPEYDYAFWNAVKSKPHNAKELEKGGSSEAGTYLPLQANSKMTAALKRESVFRSLATIAYMREPGGIVLAKYCDTESCWVPEHGMYTFSENPGEFTEYNIKAHKLGTLLKYDEAFMVDVGLNMENHLIDNIAKSFGAMEDAAYVNGKGDIQPTGILHSTRGAQVGTTTANLTYEDVVKLYFSVKPEYRKRGVWMMNDETAHYLRTLKDEGGNYIWNHTNDTILGKRVYICNDMPSTGAGNKPIAFGDFSYYWIVIRDEVNTKRREGFNQMINDALDGKIDLIVTKSVSRFARNTVDSLVTVRKLKDKGVEVFFEKENIYTLDSKGELLITIMSSLAQEESRSISENVTWGQRKRFADGKVMLPYKRFLGYRKGADGFPEIVPEEAEIVKRIYRRYMSGQTTCAIAAELTADGIPTPGGKTTWQASTVESILTNEKYKGDALLQKCFTTDFLTKKKKVNEGEVPQYYVEHSHEAIIPPNEWEDVQTEIQRRKRIGRKYSGNGIFASRIVCAECGSFFGAKVWHSNNEKYRKTIWRCNHKFDGEHRCRTPFVDESTLKDKFVTAFNTLWDTRAEIIENLHFAQMLLTDSTAIDTELEELTAELEIIVELTRKCIEENSTLAQDQNEYTARYNGYVERYESTQARIQELQKQKAERKEKHDAFESFIFAFASQEKSLTEFDEGIWCLLVETVMVHTSGDLEFRFKDGSVLKI